MFFKEDEINDELKCPKCSNKYTDPRILPCGETYCNACIHDLAESVDKSSLINCQTCGSSHQVPDAENGFPSNLVVARLLKKNSSEVYRSQNVEKLKEFLKKIQSEILEFENNKNRF